MKKIPLTASAYQEIKDTIIRLKKEEAALLIRLKEAREQGDLSENGAYKYAKMELGSTRRQLRSLRQTVDSTEVVGIPKNPTEVCFGCTVVLQDLASQKTTTYQLVSKYESDPSKGKLSFESPLGAALVGKKVAETVLFDTPRGQAQYLIVSLS